MSYLRARPCLEDPLLQGLLGKLRQGRSRLECAQTVHFSDHPEVEVAVKQTGNQMEFTIPKGWLQDEQGAIPEDLVFRAPL